MSDIAQYHPHNPDEFSDGCMATGLAEDGVVFVGIEPLHGTLLYLGRSALVEAIAELYQITVNDARARLDREIEPERDTDELVVV